MLMPAQYIRKSWKAMIGDKIYSREEACYILQVGLNAREEEVKKAYRNLVKQYHPDSNPNQNTNQVYLRIHAAYEYLQEHPYQAPVIMPARPVRIFQTNEKTKAQHRQQQKFQEERKRVLEYEKEARAKKFQEAQKRKQQVKSRQPQTQEEEILTKIRAIWLAETIKRQIEQDKQEKDAKLRKQVYQAFMQQKINEEEELKSRKSNK